MVEGARGEIRVPKPRGKSKVADFMKRRRPYVHPLSSPVHAKRSILASGKSSIKSVLEHRLSSSALDHDQFIVAGPEKFAAPWRRDKD
jgi:hypothetical protein